MFTNQFLVLLCFYLAAAYEIVGKLPADAAPYYFEHSVTIKLPQYHEISRDEKVLSKELLENRPTAPPNLPVQTDFSEQGQLFHDLEVMRVHYKYLEEGYWLTFYGEVAELVDSLRSSAKARDLKHAEDEIYWMKLSIASCNEATHQIGLALKHCKASKTKTFGYKLRHDPECIIALKNVETLQEFHSSLQTSPIDAITAPVLYKLGKKTSKSIFKRTKKKATHA